MPSVGFVPVKAPRNHPFCTFAAAVALSLLLISPASTSGSFRINTASVNCANTLTSTSRSYWKHPCPSHPTHPFRPLRTPAHKLSLRTECGSCIVPTAMRSTRCRNDLRRIIRPSDPISTTLGQLRWLALPLLFLLLLLLLRLPLLPLPTMSYPPPPLRLRLRPLRYGAQPMRLPWPNFNVSRLTAMPEVPEQPVFVYSLGSSCPIFY